MELVRAKNVSTYITVPLIDADGDVVSAASSLDSEYTYWSDLSAPVSMADCTNEAAELPTEGIYQLFLTSAEMNHDYVYVQIKSGSAKTQHVLINTTPWEKWLHVDVQVDSVLSDVDVVNAQNVSILVSTASLLANVAVVNAQNVSILISTASALANIATVNAQNVSTLISTASVLANVAILKADHVSLLISTASLLTNVGIVNAQNVSILISTASLLTKVATLTADHVSMLSAIITIDGVADAILAGMAYGSTGVSVDGLSLANQVWRFNISQASTTGMAGAYLMAAGGAADPLLNTVPGVYGAGTAGYVLGQVGIDATSLIANVNIVKANTLSLLISTASILSNVAAVKESADNNGNAIEVLRINDVSMLIAVNSTLSNVKTGIISIMVSTASLLVNVGVVDGIVDALAVSAASLLSNVANVDSDLATAQGNITTILAGTTSIAINVSSALSNIAAVAVSTASLLSNVAAIDVLIDALTVAESSILSNIAALDVLLDAILLDTGTSLPAAIAALNNLSAAEVNAQVLDVLNVDTFAEPGQEAPAATQTLSKKLGYVYKLLRNKIETTSTLMSIYDDAGTVVDQKATVADDGTTFTRGEIGSGP